MDNKIKGFKNKTKTHHLLPATALYGSPLVDEQPEGFWLGGLQLLLLRQDHGVKVWQRLGLKLWSLGGFRGNAGYHLHNDVRWRS